MESKRIPVSFRVTPQFKRALELAAQREQRSQTNLVEKLLFDFCRKSGIAVDAVPAPTDVKKRVKA
ncbi:hypothetical protein [Piscinibacter koreensis]|uniref:Ribbon-helix-helix protein CopG domain-containing protein n=1 Tax=Piscinibacter koreensis TaxID=2742824 RepID=A0A7Y6TYX9_9BURK|nr:hypothetical protein [Schlegelella koreensis]NUZ08704.1 hypothetical protein [Schlegelella koreensis]